MKGALFAVRLQTLPLEGASLSVVLWQGNFKLAVPRDAAVETPAVSEVNSLNDNLSCILH